MQMKNETDQEYAIRELEQDMEIRSRINSGYTKSVPCGYSEDEYAESKRWS